MFGVTLVAGNRREVLPVSRLWGVGPATTEKLHALGRQYGEPELNAMRGVKAVLDPEGILNPGKRVPEAGVDSRRGMYADVA